MSREAVFIRGLTNETPCETHDWPSEGMGKRLVEAMRATHPRGINVCRDCIDRARRDAVPPGPRLFEVGFNVHVRYNEYGVPFEERDPSTLAISPMTEATHAWFKDEMVHGLVQSIFNRHFCGAKITTDPEPGERPLPAGVESPRTIAAALQSEMRKTFPDEEIRVWAYGDRERETFNTMPRRVDV